MRNKYGVCIPAACSPVLQFPLIPNAPTLSPLLLLLLQMQPQKDGEQGEMGPVQPTVSPPPTPCTQQLFAAKLLCPCRAHGSACMAPLQREVFCSAVGCSVLQWDALFCSGMLCSAMGCAVLQHSVMERCFHLSRRTTPSGLLKGCSGREGFASPRGSQGVPPPISTFVQSFC